MKCCDRPKTRGPNISGQMVCPVHCSQCGHDRNKYEDYLGFCSACYPSNEEPTGPCCRP